MTSPWPYLGGLCACLFFGYFAFVRETAVPLFALADLGFHELGHFVTYWLPDVVTAAMGSILQVIVPWGLAAYFLLARSDLLGATFCLAWAASSAQNASVYIADAPYEALPLIGGHHDWAFLLGPENFDVLHLADELAAIVRTFGLVLLVGAFAICSVGLYWSGKARTAPAI
jgi:hypothetical protein